MKRKILLLPAISFILFACGEAQNSSIKATWDQDNEPNILGSYDGVDQYSSSWRDLPLKGELSKRPWSDDYWPSYKGGLTFRWNDSKVKTDEARYSYKIKSANTIKNAADVARLSPMEKFDLLLGNKDFPHTQAERARTRIMSTVPSQAEYDPAFVIPKWEGLCHAWAPAALAFDEPNVITLSNPDGLDITFGSSDIKGLLTYFLHSVESPASPILGLRCEHNFAELQLELERGNISKKAFKKLKAESACADTNAGAFHIVLANQIGSLNEGFIVDMTRDQEVWNQPVYAFETEIKSESSRPSKGAARGTVREIRVRTTMNYTVEVSQHWNAADYSGDEASKTYEYRLELDAQDQIIGGAWISEDRPDFLWKQLTPAFTGEFKAIEKIYQGALQGKQLSSQQ